MDVSHELCPLFALDKDNFSEVLTALNIFVVLLNGIFLLIILISNTLVVFVICYKPSLHTSSNIFLASQASASIAVSLLAQPSLIVLEIEEIRGNANGYCISQSITISVSIICIFVFSFSVLGIVVDQYLALQYADWHASKVTPRNTAIMVVFAWSVTTLTCSMFAAFGDTKLLVFFVIYLAVIVMFLTLPLNFKNYLRIRQYLMQVQQQLETPSNMQMYRINTPNVGRHQKVAIMVFFILVSYLITHLPFFSTLVTAHKAGWSMALKIGFTMTLTIVYISSALNSFICVRWNEEIRHAVSHILGV